MSIEAIKAVQMVYANTTKHDWPDDIWDAICEAIEIEQEIDKPLKQKRPQNCGTGFCSCIECVMEPEPKVEQKPLTVDEIWRNDRIMSLNSDLGLGIDDWIKIVDVIEDIHGIK